MKIKMLVDLSGTHNGETWPARGETADVPDQLGAKLCAAKLAEPVAKSKKTETATAPDTAEKRSSPRKRAASKK